MHNGAACKRTGNMNSKISTVLGASRVMQTHQTPRPSKQGSGGNNNVPSSPFASDFIMVPHAESPALSEGCEPSPFNLFIETNPEYISIQEMEILKSNAISRSQGFHH